MPNEDYNFITKDELIKQNIELINQSSELKSRLDEAEETLNAIQNGEVDAIVNQGSNGPEIYTLKSADYLYRMLVQEMNQGVASLTDDGTIFYSNSKLAAMLQIPLEKITGHKLTDFVQPNDLKTYINILNKGLDIVNNFQISLRSAKGTIIPVNISINSLKDAKGFNIIVTDLSEQKIYDDLKTAHKKLKESEKLYRNIIDNIQDGFFRLNKEGIITMASPSAAPMYKFNSPEEMIGLNASKFYKNSENRDHVLEQLEKYGKVENNEAETIRKDGSCFLASQNAQYHYDDQGKIQGIETLVRDITEHKKLQDKMILQSEMLSQVQDSIVVVDNNFKIIYWNKMAEELFGWVKEEVIGRSLQEILKTETKNLSREDIITQLHNEGHYYGEIVYIDKNGRHIPTEVRSATFTDLKGEIKGIITSIRDIRRRKHTEKIKQDLLETEKQLTEELRVSNEELIVTQDELNDTIVQLEKSNKELEHFAYIASHDLREPLRMISSFLQLLERRYKDKLDDDANEFIGYAVDGAKRLNNMINDLLNYSRITRHELKLERVYIKDVLEETLMNLKVTIDENNADITHYDPLPFVNGDKKLLVQLFQNLISNSIKYRSDKTPHIHISVKKEKNHFKFSVKDNGIGFDTEHSNRIFTIFQRLHGNDEFEGTGIGLAVAEKIVEQHGGEIWAESEPGKGSTFYFTIQDNVN